MRTLVEHRFVVSLACSAVVGALGIVSWPLPVANPILGMIHEQRPALLATIGYTYSTLWFTTPFFVLNVAFSFIYIFGARWDRPGSAKRLPPYPDPGQELTLLQIDQHADELEKFDVEGILSFAERVLPRASDLWVQASLDQRQRLQQLFFPDGVVFDGNRFVRTGVSTHAFRHLPPVKPAENNLASPRGREEGRQWQPATFVTGMAHERHLRDANSTVPHSRSSSW